MILTKRFIDKVSSMEGKQGRAVVLPIEEARGLRDEIAKLLIDNYELLSDRKTTEQPIQIEMQGGKF